MRFSLGKRGGDSDGHSEPMNPNGSTPAPGGTSDALSTASSPAAAQEESRAPTRSSGRDQPAPLDDDRPTLIGEQGPGADGVDVDSADGARTPADGDGAPRDASSPVAAQTNGTNGNGNGGGSAGGPPDLSGGYDAHLPIGEGPSPEGQEHRTQESGIAVPGVGSDPKISSSADDPDSDSRSETRVLDEQPPRPEPPPGATEEEYKWHTYTVYPSGKPDAVEFIDTYKAFGKNRILRGLNMGLPEGMVSMILGPSGTGKSVCIKHMVGLLYPDQGDVLVHGQSVPNMVDDDLFEMRKRFGLLFQDGALFGSMDLYDNVAFPLRQHTEKGEDEIEDTVMRRLNEVGLGHSRGLRPNELSGGMRKRAGFARALVLEPDIVLFDEPDSGLDPVRTSLLGELILEVHRDMMDDAKAANKPHLPTFCVITHNVMMARRTADYINVLWKGRIVEAGPTEDMLNSPNPFIRQFLAGESMGPLTMD
jgi:phospholipid/cholesterol/gamma-HCH transport system ATP-binding protein